MPTVFRKIINKDIPADIVYENDNYIAIRDINPQAPIHILIIPKHSVAHFHTAHTTGNVAKNKEAIYGLWDIARHIIDQLGLDGCQIHMNSGADHGQTVHHVHLHLLAHGTRTQDGTPYWH